MRSAVPATRTRPRRRSAASIRTAAALARLDITDEEAERLGPQFAAILAQFQGLAELDVDDVEPMTGTTSLADILRADEPRPSFPRERMLANAPDARDGFYGVPKTIGGDA